MGYQGITETPDFLVLNKIAHCFEHLFLPPAFSHKVFAPEVQSEVDQANRYCSRRQRINLASTSPSTRLIQTIKILSTASRIDLKEA